MIVQHQNSSLSRPQIAPSSHQLIVRPIPTSGPFNYSPSQLLKEGKKSVCVSEARSEEDEGIYTV